jgi:hypothetical protein
MFVSKTCDPCNMWCCVFQNSHLHNVIKLSQQLWCVKVESKVSSLPSSFSYCLKSLMFFLFYLILFSWSIKTMVRNLSSLSNTFHMVDHNSPRHYLCMWKLKAVFDNQMYSLYSKLLIDSAVLPLLIEALLVPFCWDPFNSGATLSLFLSHSGICFTFYCIIFSLGNRK